MTSVGGDVAPSRSTRRDVFVRKYLHVHQVCRRLTHDCPGEGTLPFSRGRCLFAPFAREGTCSTSCTAPARSTWRLHSVSGSSERALRAYLRYADRYLACNFYDGLNGSLRVTCDTWSLAPFHRAGHSSHTRCSNAMDVGAGVLVWHTSLESAGTLGNALVILANASKRVPAISWHESPSSQPSRPCRTLHRIPPHDILPSSSSTYTQLYPRIWLSRGNASSL